MNLQKLIELVQIPDEQILNIYLAGSRVFGTAQDDSDWDFVIVVDNAAASLLKDGRQEGEGRVEVPGLLDVTLYTDEAFRKLLNHHLPLMVCLSLQSEMIWRQKVDFSIGFSLDLAALRTAVSKIASQGFGYAKICFEKNNDIRKSKKNIVHSIRNTQYGIQLARDGRISDLKCSVGLYNQIMKEESTDWAFYQEKYGSLGKETHKQFLELVPPKELSTKAAERKAKIKQKTQEKRKRQHSAKPEDSVDGSGRQTNL